MGTMIGFAMGYMLGTRAGERGWEELRESWKTISTSGEMRDLLSGGLALARDLLRQGATLMAERLDQGERGVPLRAA
jgi:hypothetical protein